MSEVKKYGRYEVREVLGRGAMGVVYVAEDPVIGRKVAIKVVTAHEGLEEHEREQMQARFEREFQSAGRLSHPNIVSVHDVGQEGDDTFIAMEYIQGESLQSILAASRAFSFKEVADLAVQLCSALDYAHEKGIVHRDIKPANILVTHDGRPKITDFGVAKVATTTLTRTGTIVGTPAYMSPEQVTGHPVTGAADQFSMAVMLYQMLTGERPFSGENPTTIMYKIVHEEPVKPSVLNVAVPAPVDQALMRALDKDPEYRYPTCVELAERLRAALGAAPVEATVLMTAGDSEATAFDPSIARSHARDGAEPAKPATPAVARPKRRPWGVLAAVGVAVASIALVYWVWLGGGWAGEGTTPRDPPGAAAPAVSTELQVSAPDGIEIWVDGVDSGVSTPNSLPLTGQPGEELSIELRSDGEVLASRTFTLDNDLPIAWSPEGIDELLAASQGGGPADDTTGPDDDAGVAPPPPEPVTFTVVSDPANATVTLNGERLDGVTPLSVSLDPTGEHSIRVELDGYNPEGTTVSPATMSQEKLARGQLDFPLTPAIPPGFLALDNTGARRGYPVAVTIRRSDGAGKTVSREESTSHRIDLLPGTYIVELSAPTVFFSDTQSVVIASGQESQLERPLPAAVTVSVGAYPERCGVSIDGTFAGSVPFTQTLTVGVHMFEFDWSEIDGGKKSVRKTIRRDGEPIFEAQQR